MDLPGELHAVPTRSPAHFAASGQDQGLEKGSTPHSKGEASTRSGQEVGGLPECERFCANRGQTTLTR